MNPELFFSPNSFIDPQLSPAMLIAIRVGYAVIMLGTLLTTLTNPRFFLCERWGGYAESSRSVDILHNPRMYPIIQAVWIGCMVLLIIGQWTVLAALINVILARYFFIYMRWKSVSRGMGAPGFIAYWMGMVVLILEFTTAYAPSLFHLGLLLVQIDFAVIMFSAGFYKLQSGYAQRNGMELGCCNPQWSYFPDFYKKRSPSHWTMQTFNQLAWSMEILGAVMMLIPPLRFLGGLLIFLSFGFILPQIRLGWLTYHDMLCSLVFFHPGSLGDQLISQIMPLSLASSNPTLVFHPMLINLIGLLFVGYLILLPLAQIGLYSNFYLKYRLPTPFQTMLERYTNFFGMIVWRVFSQDLVNFYIMIYHQPKGGGERTTITHYGWKGGIWGNRYSHVGESILITSLFTTLKYYPSNTQRFQERLLRYSRTLPVPDGHEIVYEYVSLGKNEDETQVTETILAEHIVDLEQATVTEVILNDSVSIRAPISVSPVHEGVTPGSYVPKKV